jgi:two-component system, OmpR family, sensor kinase
MNLQAFSRNNRLFFKVYMTLLGSLALAALIIGLFTMALQREPRLNLIERSTRFLDMMIPAEQSPYELQNTVRRIANALNAGVAVFSPDGKLLAIASSNLGPPLPPMARLMRMAQRGERQTENLVSVDLADGRRVITNLEFPKPPSGFRSPGFVIFMIAGAIGLGAYPVVRHFTRRLEILRKGVETWGQGELDTRVSETGQDEISSVARTFNQAAAQIERLIAGHRSLLANASHELRSPLARLRMATELYETVQSDSIKSEIIRNLAELDMLVEEILLASRLDSVSGLERSENVAILAIAAEEASAEGIEVGGEEVTVLGDPRLLRRLVRNLVQNAKRHGQPPICVTVARTQDNLMRLTVRDHGAGLPQAESTRVFEPFYRPSGRSETAGGWGLGLSLVRQIADHHGGKVYYQTPEGGGASFVVDLPAV